MSTSWTAAAGSAIHLLGVSGAVAFSVLRLVALRRRDVEGIRFADNGNGLAAILLYGAGLYRLFGELEKPVAYYTANHVFWLKMGLLGVIAVLEAYPQYVVFPWHMRAARKLPIEPKPGQIERVFKFAAWQMPCLVGIIVCASLMAHGIGLQRSQQTSRAPASGEALYSMHCQVCHQADGRGLGGTVAADFTASPGVLDKTDDELLESVSAGRTGSIGTMPAMGGVLPEEERRATLAWIRARYRPAPSSSATP
ncbi:MAG: DUF2214 family protein [Polyangiaceae bacterium]